jgi:hypothetical protein
MLVSSIHLTSLKVSACIVIGGENGRALMCISVLHVVGGENVADIDAAARDEPSQKGLALILFKQTI